MAYRQVKIRGKNVKQVLIEWEGLASEDKSWEDLNMVQKLMTEGNLEDKLSSADGRDVTVELDLNIVVERLKAQLEIQDKFTGDQSNEHTVTGKSTLRKSARV